jgi:catechol 2,3-dioxygenase-like lactoylglutathione lyase family enzyme
MLVSEKIIAFLVTRDYEQSRVFFEQTLGFQFVSLDAYALVMRAGETMLRITKNRNFQPAQGTVLGWEVRDIESLVLWLKGRGVTLESYPFVQDKELGIWTAPSGDRVAWFKDPDGNVLSVSEHVGLQST